MPIRHCLTIYAMMYVRIPRKSFVGYLGKSLEETPGQRKLRKVYGNRLVVDLTRLKLIRTLSQCGIW